MTHRTDMGWTDVIVERTVQGPLSVYDACAEPDDTLGCYDMYRIEWLESLIGVDTERLICRFRAPDAESVRIALRNMRTDFDALWVGTVHGIEESTERNVVVEYRFDTPGPRDAAEAIRTVSDDCLIQHQLKLSRTIISRDRTRAVCICEAPINDTSASAGAWAATCVAARRQGK